MKKANFFNVTTVILSVVLLSCARQSDIKLTLPQIIQDHMVVQMEKPIKVWGWAAPGARINVRFNGSAEKAFAGKDGSWTVVFPPMDAGGPYTMNISNKDTSINIIDILIGEVWICSGQSNMEWRLDASSNGQKELAELNFPQIRTFLVKKDIEFTPQKDIRNAGVWIKGDSLAVATFSAVAWYFGKELHKNLNVPVGLIGSYWGGTVAEAWMSRSAIMPFHSLNEKVAIIDTISYSVKEFEALANAGFEEWKEKAYYSGEGLSEEWYKPETNISDWNDIEVPGYWEDLIPNMKAFDGVVWYRKEFDIPASFKGKDLEIWLSQIVDHDIAWLNGSKIGETFTSSPYRGYVAPKALLKEKGNVLVVRVYNAMGKGGFAGLPEYFDFYPVNNRSVRKTTAGIWKFKAEKPDSSGNPNFAAHQQIGPNDYPTTLYNAMINPIVNYTIRGAIWYQGESNADRAYQYRELFPALINDWRKQWAIGDFPFLFVQLANFKEMDKQPPLHCAWAELREAQDLTQRFPATGMATIIDIGDANDIHPTNKTDVGKRLALQALHKAYGIDTLYSGPVYKSHSFLAAGEVQLVFDHVGSGLATSDGKAPAGFALAGNDSVFYWAEALLQGTNQVIISSPKVPEAKYVRYAWGNNPVTNLYNSSQLPAVPFRTDTIAGITK